MPITEPTTLIALGALMVGLAAPAPALAQLPAEPVRPLVASAPPAVLPGARADLAEQLADPAVLRARPVAIDLAPLELDDREARERAPRRRVRLELFDDVRLEAVHESTEAAYGGGYVASFAIEGDPAGEAFVSVVNGALTASVRSGGRTFAIRGLASGRHVALEVDEGRHPGCGVGPEDVVVSPAAPPPPGSTGPESRIADVLVVYTDDVRVSYGGVDGITSLINLVMFETNKSYANSDVDLRVNLVHVAEVGFNEAAPGGPRRAGPTSSVPTSRWIGAEVEPDKEQRT
jgi:hypothetical protein